MADSKTRIMDERLSPRPWREELRRFLQSRPELSNVGEIAQFKEFMKVREISVQLLERRFYGEETPMPVPDVISSLQHAIAEIPDDYRESARVQVAAYSDWGAPFCSVTISYRRPRREDIQRLRKMEAETDV